MMSGHLSLGEALNTNDITAPLRLSVLSYLPPALWHQVAVVLTSPPRGRMCRGAQSEAIRQRT